VARLPIELGTSLGGDGPLIEQQDFGERVTQTPLHAHVFNDAYSRALVIPLTGARLLGPDAREIAASDDYDHYLQARRATSWLP
jgi:hypothetical protein